MEETMTSLVNQQVISHADLKKDYLRLRATSRDLHSRIMKIVTSREMEASGRALGIMQKGVFVFETEDTTAVMMDYCFHDVHCESSRPLERYLAHPRDVLTSEHRDLLTGLVEARFSIFVVESSVSGVGVTVRDLLNSSTCFVHDVAMGTSAPQGLLFGMRLVTVGPVTMSTGASLPLPPTPESDFKLLLAVLLRAASVSDPSRMTPDDSARFSAAVIRFALQSGASAYFTYREVGSPLEGIERRSPSQSRSLPALIDRLPRNALCPCGSGRKVKNCCGKSS
jgi:hypothetical protein